MSKAKADTYGNGDVTYQKPSFGARLKRNCARWWWLYFLILAGLVLVIVLPLIYVGYPRRAQKNVNAAELEVISQEIFDPRPDSFRLRQTNMLYSDSDQHPKLDGFRAALFLERTMSDIEPFAFVPIPPAKVSEETRIEIDADVPIASQEQFAAYTQLVLASEEFRVASRGRVGLKVSGLPKTTVNFNKVATMKGLNRLQGLNITDLEVKRGEPDGANLIGVVSIPNPSVITLHMGNVTLNLSVDGEPIGTSLLRDFVLKPGTHEYEMRSTTNTGTVLKLLTTKYKTGVLPLEIVGNSSIVNGEHLTYYEAAIRKNVIKLDLNVAPALQEFGLNIGGGES